MPDKMTPERALIVLNQCNTDGRIKVDRQELKEAVKMASEAIKRRIPRKPVPREHKSWIIDCPSCGSCAPTSLCSIYAYCERCGQALDWSDFD